jgi:hypothetical protein
MSLQPGEAQFNPSVELSGRLGAFCRAYSYNEPRRGGAKPNVKRRKRAQKQREETSNQGLEPVYHRSSGSCAASGAGEGPRATMVGSTAEAR